MKGRCHKCGCRIIDNRCVGCRTIEEAHRTARAKIYVDQQLALGCIALSEKKIQQIVSRVLDATPQNPDLSLPMIERLIESKDEADAGLLEPLDWNIEDTP